MLTTILSFILVLGVLVFVHELGHYLAARHVGVRVERFSIGFPPRAVGKTIGETEYILSWIPLGGYVKLFGQNIEDEDPDDPRNYAAKSKLQRAYILFAGPAMNLVAASLLMTAVYMMGVEIPAWRFSPPTIAKVTEGSPAGKAGFLPEDRIVSLAGTPASSWNVLFDTMERQVIEGESLSFVVERGEKRFTLHLDPDLIAAGKHPGWRPMVPAVVGDFPPQSPAKEAGIMAGDRIVAINGEPIGSWNQIPAEIQRVEGGTIHITVERGSGNISIPVTPQFNEERQRWMIGIAAGTTIERHGVSEAVVLGSKQLYTITRAIFMFLGRCLSLNCAFATLGGPLKIAEYSGKAARRGVVPMMTFMAIISLQLGILNLLPIPALDGGHLFFLGVEALKRGPLSPRLRERSQLIGLSLLILLMLAVLFNDVIQMFSPGSMG